jgi:excinuclease ABC subunit A
LSKRATGKTLYILDEPTTGLHIDDVGKLLTVLHALVDAGNSMIIIEHNLDVIKQADYIIDMGPDGGEAGGQIVAKGSPKSIAENPNSYTGRFIKSFL